MLFMLLLYQREHQYLRTIVLLQIFFVTTKNDENVNCTLK